MQYMNNNSLDKSVRLCCVLIFYYLIFSAVLPFNSVSEDHDQTVNILMLIIVSIFVQFCSNFHQTMRM